MSPSGAELLRTVKERINEVDPAAVHEQMNNGATIVDVREAEEFAAGHLPGAKHVPRGYLESRIEGIVPDRARLFAACRRGPEKA
jgi:rhodanese-related sulfurtransferase